MHWTRTIQAGNLAAAQADAQTIISFVQLKAAQGTLTATHAQVQALLSGVSCYAGLSPDTFLILPSDLAQVVRANGGQSGISLQPNTVNVPTLVTITVLTTPPLETQLDQYPGFIHITQSSPLTKPAVVAVCPAPTGIPAEVLGRLRLGHQATPGAAGFEVTPRADASFLVCSTPTVPSLGQSRIGGWLQRLASLVTPKPLYAKVLEDRSGVGGLVSEFSPFGPVDPELNLRGGVGGLVSEFRKAPPTDGNTGRIGSPAPASPKSPGGLTPSTTRAPDARVNTVVNGVCTQIDGIFGTSVETACRPAVTITTFQGHPFNGVSVAWAIAQGGGLVAPQTVTNPSNSCGAFGATASTTTDASGSASVCWSLGGTPGPNKVIATPTAPNGVFFSSTNVTFTAVANPITPTAGATGGTFPYDGSGHAGAGTCSNGLTPALSYTGGVLVPTDAGTYTLTVTCGAGNPLYATVTQPATIVITPAATTTTILCPASAVYTGSLADAVHRLGQRTWPVAVGDSDVLRKRERWYSDCERLIPGGWQLCGEHRVGGDVPGDTSAYDDGRDLCGAGHVHRQPTNAMFGGGKRTGTDQRSGHADVRCKRECGDRDGECSVPGWRQLPRQHRLGHVHDQSCANRCGDHVSHDAGDLHRFGRFAVQRIGLGASPRTKRHADVHLEPRWPRDRDGQLWWRRELSAEQRIGDIQDLVCAVRLLRIANLQRDAADEVVAEKGSNVPLKCALLNAQGGGVTNAQGSLPVEDRGLDGMATPVAVVSRRTRSRRRRQVNYSYGLDTSATGSSRSTTTSSPPPGPTDRRRRAGSTSSSRRST